MPIDPSIPLQAQGAQPFTLNSIAQMMQMKSAIAQQRQAQAVQNSLAAIYANPGNLGPDGLPNADAVRQISAISPDLGIKLQTEKAKIDSERALTQERASTVMKNKAEMIHNDLLDPAMVAYDSARSSGLSEQAARAKAQAVYSDSIDGLKKSGQFSDQEMAQMPSSFDPDRVRAGAIKYKDYLGIQEKGKADERADARMAQIERHERVMEGLAEAREGRIERELAAANAPPSKDGTVGGFTPEDIDILARKDRAGLPLNLSRGKSMDPVRRAITERQLQIAKEEGGDAKTAVESMQQGKAETAAVGSTMKDFTSGKAGQTVRSINVSMSHLDTLKNLSDALHNGDMPAFNRFANKVAEQTGHAAPTNFDAAKAIIGDEVVKAIVGAGGTGADREKAQAAIDGAKSPEQVAGVIDTYQDLFAGQLKGLGQQYKSGTKRSDFSDKFLSPAARKFYKPDTEETQAKGKVLTYDPATGTFK